jgi:hypothetical protein
MRATDANAIHVYNVVSGPYDDKIGQISKLTPLGTFSARSRGFAGPRGCMLLRWRAAGRPSSELFDTVHTGVATNEFVEHIIDRFVTQDAPANIGCRALMSGAERGALVDAADNPGQERLAG